MFYALPALAVASVIGAVIASEAVGVSFRDPDNVLGRRPFILLAIMVAFWAADVLPRTLVRGRGRSLKRAFAEVNRERWSRRRAVTVLVAVLSFYAIYLAYRNLKSIVPLVREATWDQPLRSLDQAMALGSDPGELLHNLLGTGIAADVLALVYVFFLLFVPLSLGAALVWSSDTVRGIQYTIALSLNWLIGAASYYVVPSLGPAFLQNRNFSDLPETSASSLQELLRDERITFLASPATGGTQGVAAFASLHVSIVFTAALMANVFGLRKSIRVALWVYLGLTMLATVYFGWHYIVDDLAGLMIGGFSVLLAGLIVGRGRLGRFPVNVPNALTVGRICLVPVLVALLLEDAYLLAAAVFGAGALSDALDGHLARRKNQITDLGKVLDPLADKLLVGSALICLAAAGRLPAWVAAVILAREVIVTLVRSGAGRRGMVLSASSFGKAKTSLQIVTVLVVLLAPDPQAPWVMSIVWTTVAVTVLSGLDYAAHLRRRSEPVAV